MSKPDFTKPHLCFSATEPPHSMPEPRFSQPPRSLWAKLLTHHRPSPIRRTAIHSAYLVADRSADSPIMCTWMFYHFGAGNENPF